MGFTGLALTTPLQSPPARAGLPRSPGDPSAGEGQGQGAGGEGGRYSSLRHTRVTHQQILCSGGTLASPLFQQDGVLQSSKCPVPGIREGGGWAGGLLPRGPRGEAVLGASKCAQAVRARTPLSGRDGHGPVGLRPLTTAGRVAGHSGVLGQAAPREVVELGLS